MVMHRRRRSSRLGSWLDAILPDSVRGGPRTDVTVTASASTKKALKAEAMSKARLEKQLARGSECCPVIRTKCEMREVTVQIGRAHV